MLSMTYHDFQEMIISHFHLSKIYEMRNHDNVLIALILVDCFEDGLSAVYSAYQKSL